MDEGTIRRLRQIEDRLTAIEGRLTPTIGSPTPTDIVTPEVVPPGIDAGALATPAGVAPRPPDVIPTRTMSADVIPFARVAPPPLPPRAPQADAPTQPTPDSDRYAANVRAAWDGDPPVGVVPSRPAFATTASTGSRSADRPDASLEHVIGLKWAGWIGAIVLIVGVALGFKFAYDQGYFGRLPDAVRWAMLAAGGVVLIGLGEAVYRRIDRAAAAGLYGAGVATLFLAAYAGEAWYALLSPTNALLAMAAAAVVGMAIAARADLVSVAVLSVVGGALAPGLFADGPVHRTTGLLAYVLFLQATAIGLCAWRATPKWWPLRGLSLAITALWLLGPGPLAPGGPPAALAIAVTLLSAAAYQGELIRTTARRPAALFVGGRLEPARGVTFSLLTTVFLVASLLELLTSRTERVQGAAVLAVAACVFAIARVLARLAEGRLRALARGFDVQAMLLLTLAVPILLHGPSLLIGWMLLSVGLAVTAAITRDRFALGGAVGVWALSLLMWLAWSVDDAAARAVWLNLLGTAVTARVVLAGLLAVSGHVIGTVWQLGRAGVVRPVVRPDNYQAASDDDDRASRGPHRLPVFDFAAAAVLCGGLFAYATPQFATTAALAYAWTLALVSFVPLLGHLGPIGLAVLGATTLKWAALDVIGPERLTNAKSTLRPFFNEQAATGVGLAASIAAMGGLLARRTDAVDADARRADQRWAIAFGLAFVVLGFVLSHEVVRDVAVRRLAGGFYAWPGPAGVNPLLTILWAGCAVAWRLSLSAVLRTDAARREVGTCLRLLAFALAAKFVFFDETTLYSVDEAAASAGIGRSLRLSTAGVVIAFIAVFGRTTRRNGESDSVTGLATLVVLLVAGSVEIDRYAATLPGTVTAPAWIVRQAGWSIYWGTLAVATLVVGFVRRRRTLRIAALGLLGVTLGKVMLVDLSGVGTGWRIVSLLALGALLLVTSVLYGKFLGSGEERPAEQQSR